MVDLPGRKPCWCSEKMLLLSNDVFHSLACNAGKANSSIYKCLRKLERLNDY